MLFRKYIHRENNKYIHRENKTGTSTQTLPSLPFMQAYKVSLSSLTLRKIKAVCQVFSSAT